MEVVGIATLLYDSIIPKEVRIDILLGRVLTRAIVRAKRCAVDQGAITAVFYICNSPSLQPFPWELSGSLLYCSSTVPKKFSDRARSVVFKREQLPVQSGTQRI
jgi:hypothetical protein